MDIPDYMEALLSSVEGFLLFRWIFQDTCLYCGFR